MLPVTARLFFVLFSEKVYFRIRCKSIFPYVIKVGKCGPESDQTGNLKIQLKMILPNILLLVTLLVQCL